MRQPRCFHHGGSLTSVEVELVYLVSLPGTHIQLSHEIAHALNCQGNPVLAGSKINIVMRAGIVSEPLAINSAALNQICTLVHSLVLLVHNVW